MVDEPISLNLNSEDIEETTLPSLTYHVQNNRITGKVDGLESIRQAVHKILLTELFEWEIYSEIYGTELNRLIGQDFDFVLSDIERTVEDALTYDDRVEGIENFEIMEQENDRLHIRFNVVSIEGSFVEEMGVEI